jgi:hypothetical protein
LKRVLFFKQRLTRRAMLHGENRYVCSISRLPVRAVLQKKLVLEVVFRKRLIAEAVYKGGKEPRCKSSTSKEARHTGISSKQAHQCGGVSAKAYYLGVVSKRSSLQWRRFKERHTTREVSSQQATFAESESQTAVVWTVGKTLHS